MRAKWAAMITFENPINSLSAIGLALGALCGMAGTFVAHPHIQALLWPIEGAALVMAAALLTLKHFRSGPASLGPIDPDEPPIPQLFTAQAPLRSGRPLRAWNRRQSRIFLPASSYIGW